MLWTGWLRWQAFFSHIAGSLRLWVLSMIQERHHLILRQQFHNGVPSHQLTHTHLAPEAQLWGLVSCM